MGDLSARTVVLAVVAGLVLTCASCGSTSTAAGRASPSRTASSPAVVRTDVPEPAKAPPVTQRPAGTVVALPGAPEGMAVDDSGGILVVGVRSPDGIALVDTATGRERKLVRLPG